MFCSQETPYIPTEHIKYPCVVKASKGEDSKSGRLVKDQQSLDTAIEHALTYSNQVIIERYRKIPKIRPSMYKPLKIVTQKTLP